MIPKILTSGKILPFSRTISISSLAKKNPTPKLVFELGTLQNSSHLAKYKGPLEFQEFMSSHKIDTTNYFINPMARDIINKASTTEILSKIEKPFLDETTNTGLGRYSIITYIDTRSSLIWFCGIDPSITLNPRQHVWYHLKNKEASAGYGDALAFGIMLQHIRNPKLDLSEYIIKNPEQFLGIGNISLDREKQITLAHSIWHENIVSLRPKYIGLFHDKVTDDEQKIAEEFVPKAMQHL